MSLSHADAAPFGTLILPAYNAEAFLEQTLRDVHLWLSRRAEAWELIIVDDGSRDRTPEILDAFGALRAGEAIRFLRFDVNHGKGFAVRAGLEQARGSVSVFTDCDLAYPMANVDEILSRLSAGADAAIACRVLPASTYLIRPSFFSYLFTRHVMGRVFNAISRVIAVPRLLDTQAGLKGFKTSVVKPLLPHLRLDGFSFDVEVLRGLLDAKARIEEVPVAFRYDSEPSTMAFTRDAIRMLRDLIRVRVRSERGRYARESHPRRLIVHADDYGLSPGVNGAIEEGLVAGALQSASILVGGRHGEAALRWARAHPELDFGVHLNLTQGMPVSDPARVPTLVDARGRFRSLGPFLARVAAGRIERSEIDAEWRAQIAIVRAAGVRISHLDSHHHVHLWPSIFRGVAARLATEEGVPLRAMDGPIAMQLLHPNWTGLALALATRWSVGHRFRHLVVAHGAGAGLRDRPTLDGLRATLSAARPGETIELVVHPGFPDDALSASGDSYREGRPLERALLLSDDARSWLRVRGFTRSTFRTAAGAAGITRSGGE